MTKVSCYAGMPNAYLKFDSVERSPIGSGIMANEKEDDEVAFEDGQFDILDELAEAEMTNLG